MAASGRRNLPQGNGGGVAPGGPGEGMRTFHPDPTLEPARRRIDAPHLRSNAACAASGQATAAVPELLLLLALFFLA